MLTRSQVEARRTQAKVCGANVPIIPGNAMVELMDDVLALMDERDALLEDAARAQERSFTVNEEFAVMRDERDALRAALVLADRAFDRVVESGTVYVDLLDVPQEVKRVLALSTPQKLDTDWSEVAKITRGWTPPEDR